MKQLFGRATAVAAQADAQLWAMAECGVVSDRQDDAQLWLESVLLAVSGESPAARPPVSDESPAARPPVSDESPAARPPVSGESPAARPPVSGESPAARPPVSGESPAARPPVSDESPAARPPVSDESPAARPPVSGESPAARPPVSGESPAARPPVSGESPAARPPVSDESPAARPPVSDELGSEAAYSGQLRAQLPAATAEAAAALWRCVQPLLQATLLATPSLTPEAVRMLAALRGVRTQLEGMGVQAESFEPRLPEIARDCPRVQVKMGLEPIFTTWLAHAASRWQSAAATTAAAATSSEEAGGGFGLPEAGPPEGGGVDGGAGEADELEGGEEAEEEEEAEAVEAEVEVEEVEEEAEVEEAEAVEAEVEAEEEEVEEEELEAGGSASEASLLAVLRPLEDRVRREGSLLFDAAGLWESASLVESLLSGVGREALREAGPVETIGDATSALRPLLRSARLALASSADAPLAAEAIVTALLLRYAELAAEIGRADAADEAEPPPLAGSAP
ncbi:hypothetical protein EMIHUDRAFT_116095 [Emiliania huxleyi CCMP1516]|uniref:Uncharacterized protein n=2 Tax=Emiliania huxleyi TaxID=2903 RepID=A0A0D3JKZ5_EMIH1|nr:hypothetical protein EMIHUDRAFT_116095 [Emiliania huxleyi CCMP1516]EOD24180.1 hypothetical protein EMIHUDRAFT_116095 [Emiliania huxleyi CCMP1516]|eukprot:XP_005776609.1 hypothetical protein EMIHUDRAFT_116095 [Emiliania huxleyi CCMP1516]